MTSDSGGENERGVTEGAIRLRARAVTRINLPEIDVLWDRDAGTLSGAGAEMLRAMAVWCEDHGGIVEYRPTGLRTRANALHDAAALALMFMSLGYITPEPLRPALAAYMATLPKQPPLPPDTVY